MPHRTRAQERIDQIDVSPTKLLAEIDELKGRLEASEAEAAEYLAGLQRERAEFQNFRRRTSDERERDAGLAADFLLRKVVALADDFDRAIEARPPALADDSWAEGIAAIDRKLRLLLESEGVTADRDRARRPVRSARARGDRDRARLGACRGDGRDRAPARLPDPRPRPPPGARRRCRRIVRRRRRERARAARRRSAQLTTRPIPHDHR